MTDRTCLECDRRLPADAPGGLCPHCLMGAAVDSPRALGADLDGLEPDDRAILAVETKDPDLEVGRVIGRGGAAVVFEATRKRLGRRVALKVLDGSHFSDAESRRRFELEARLIGRLSHPNIVTLHGLGESSGYVWLELEHVEGLSLREILNQEGRLQPRRAAAVAAAVASALAAAHDAEVTHRDLKPENVVIARDGAVKLVDFGIAVDHSGHDAADRLTRSSHLIGTPHYMAPEQILSAKAASARSDLFSLGVLLYEMLTGTLPIGRFHLPSTLVACDPRFDALVESLLESRPEDRPRDARAVRDRLIEIGRGAPAQSVVTAASDPNSKGSVAPATASGAAEILRRNAILVVPAFLFFLAATILFTGITTYEFRWTPLRLLTGQSFIRDEEHVGFVVLHGILVAVFLGAALRSAKKPGIIALLASAFIGLHGIVAASARYESDRLFFGLLLLSVIYAAMDLTFLRAASWWFAYKADVLPPARTALERSYRRAPLLWGLARIAGLVLLSLLVFTLASTTQGDFTRHLDQFTRLRDERLFLVCILQTFLVHGLVGVVVSKQLSKATRFGGALLLLALHAMASMQAHSWYRDDVFGGLLAGTAVVIGALYATRMAMDAILTGLESAKASRDRRR